MTQKAKEKALNLVIVESPAKAKTIEKFLGKDFLVKSSYGHIRDLAKKDFGVDVSNNYQPQYVISSDKKDVVKELISLVQQSETVWLASDEDREGEAIAWHLYEVLGLTPAQTKRIVFHEITKEAILKAIKNPRPIDINLVDAQQARRVLDRLVGFELSPVLWKKVKPSLSAGRVQSVAVRLLVEREREINAFNADSAFRVVARFFVTDEDGKKHELRAELNHRFKTEEEAFQFLTHCKNGQFTVEQVTRKPFTKSPAAPFTTSTLQQEASRKLGFSVGQTMSVAQRLYEAGKITYMRTDSVNLADTAVSAAVQKIKSDMGEKYVQTRQFKTKSKGAQEAHEAIRPTYIDKDSVSGTAAEQKLYDLIYKRTLASQMSDARIERTNVNITVSGSTYKFHASGEVILFDGFLKMYIESSDVEKEDEEAPGFLPPLKEQDVLGLMAMEARERWTQKPPRYSEAALVRKLEEQGIGRPSTYAPTISTIQQRGYVVKEDRPGNPRKYRLVQLEGGEVKKSVKTENAGAERSKLFPTDIGMVVNDFLVKYFPNIVDYEFTAKVEKEFDQIAVGDVQWTKAIDQFYQPFHNQVEETLEKSERNTGERVLGTDPKTGKPVIVRIGRYGPMAQLGDTEAEDEKPAFASLTREQSIETITLEEALKLFELPRDLGLYEEKKVVVGIGRFGPYVRHDGKFASLKKGVDDPMEISLQRAIELIEEKRERDNKKIIKSFEEEPDLQILNGRWGPYIGYKGKNFKIPKEKDAEKLTLEECLKLVEDGGKKAPATKKATTKKKTTASGKNTTASKSTKAKKSAAKK
ncbi:type I DNA topoisomerase [Alkalitalea saponilacus]|uniref:DNA topoisomerase 1 n=1 Tax=Alkalitalea saponilacus TaxID=889453 RepID=A0A1T5HMI0_9BACT|nr:type I DNA topoisomerase [Alkalitalea saponilacus]ASB49396.1 DNA topoisomerase I [Alkalitalea saponilacus]SKC21857.1 DNA topoisomerase-1 [Alkalitalea saponilacus]